MTMTIREFDSALMKPLFVWRMAKGNLDGILEYKRRGYYKHGERDSAIKSCKTRMERSSKQIIELVERAAQEGLVLE